MFSGEILRFYLTFLQYFWFFVFKSQPRSLKRGKDLFYQSLLLRIYFLPFFPHLFFRHAQSSFFHSSSFIFFHSSSAILTIHCHISAPKPEQHNLRPNVHRPCRSDVSKMQLRHRSFYYWHQYVFPHLSYLQVTHLYCHVIFSPWTQPISYIIALSIVFVYILLRKTIPESIIYYNMVPLHHWCSYVA